MRAVTQFLGFAALVAWAAPAWADECVDPYQRTVQSPSKKYAIQFTPQKRDCSKEYSCGDDPKTTGELEGSPTAPTLALFELSHRGRKKRIWSRLLDDGYEPMGMAVSDDGRHVMLADDWCGSGLGDNVVVLLGPDGTTQHSWSLAQVLPADYAGALVQTSPNIHWRGGMIYDPTTRAFNFQVAVPNGERFGEQAGFVDLLLDPETRMFTPRDQARWTQAHAMGRARVEAICGERKWELARAAVPLSAPTVTDRKTWRNFAAELEKRLAYPASGSVWNQPLFLPLSRDPNYESDLREFRRRLTFVRSTNIKGNFYLVSPDLPNAHAVLKEFLAGEKEPALGNHRFVILGDQPAASQVTATITATGGKDIRIVGLREVLPPAAKQEDYDWQGKRACDAIAEHAAQTHSR